MLPRIGVVMQIWKLCVQNFSISYSYDNDELSGINHQGTKEQLVVLKEKNWAKDWQCNFVM